MAKQRTIIITFFLLTVGLWSCTRMSETALDSNAGVNGGFEISQDGLPVNWIFYTPNTVPDANFKLTLDDKNFEEGRQSLKFEVKECSATGGWKSPGFINEFYEDGVGKFQGPGLYKIGFWIQNEGAKYHIGAGGVASKAGEIETLMEGDFTIKNWTYFEHKVDVPSGQWLKMELSILSPGIFWIDDITINKLR